MYRTAEERAEGVGPWEKGDLPDRKRGDEGAPKKKEGIQRAAKIQRGERETLMGDFRTRVGSEKVRSVSRKKNTAN